MSYTCKRCSTSYTEKKSLIIHLQRKAPCDILIDDIDRSVLLKDLVKDRNVSEYKYLCVLCKKGFRTTSNRINHEKICKHNANLSNVEEQKIDHDNIDEKDKIINELRLEIDRLKATSPNNYNFVTQNVNINNMTQNIYIHNFGEENLEHLKQDLIKHFININIPKLIKDIHFNTNVPQNMNIQWNDDHIQRRENNKWIKVPISTGINQLIISKAKILENVEKHADISKNLEKNDISDSMRILKRMKQSAIKKEESELHWDVALRLKKEQQRAISRDKKSDEPYCYVMSPEDSEDSEDSKDSEDLSC